jgi:hypothetical protein
LWSGEDRKGQEWTLNRRPIGDHVARRTPRVQPDAVVDVDAPGLSAVGRGWASAPIVNVGTGHGERRGPHGPRTGEHLGLCTGPSLRPAPPAGLAALPTAGRPLRDAEAHARGALRAGARPAAAGGVGDCGEVPRLRAAGTRVRARTLHRVPRRVPDGVPRLRGRRPPRHRPTLPAPLEGIGRVSALDFAGPEILERPKRNL